MQKLPQRATDKRGNMEDFSLPVLLFDKEEPTFCNIGHYNFDTETWSHFGEESMKLICWCYIPNPTDYIKKMRFLTHVLHDGYRA